MEKLVVSINNQQSDYKNIYNIIMKTRAEIFKSFKSKCPMRFIHAQKKMHMFSSIISSDSDSLT